MGLVVWTVRGECDGEGCDEYSIEDQESDLYKDGWVKVGDKLYCPACAAKRKGEG